MKKLRCAAISTIANRTANAFYGYQESYGYPGPNSGVSYCPCELEQKQTQRAGI